MFIENKSVSIKIHDLNPNTDVDSVIQEIKFPLTTENYTYGIFKETKVGNRLLFDFICLYKTVMETISIKDGEILVENNSIKKSSIGKFSIQNGKLELFNCDNVIKGILENEFGNGQLSKYIISDQSYSKLYNLCFIKTSEIYVLTSGGRKYKINVRSDGSVDTKVDGILQNQSLSSTSFNGQLIADKQLSFKLNRNGNIMLYNNQSNPLIWEDVCDFLDSYVY